MQMNQYHDISDEEEGIESENLGIVESLDMLDKVIECIAVDEESQSVLYRVIKNPEGLCLKKRRQQPITLYFTRIFGVIYVFRHVHLSV